MKVNCCQTSEWLGDHQGARSPRKFYSLRDGWWGANSVRLLNCCTIGRTVNYILSCKRVRPRKYNTFCAQTNLRPMRSWRKQRNTPWICWWRSFWRRDNENVVLSGELSLSLLTNQKLEAKSGGMSPCYSPWLGSPKYKYFPDHKKKNGTFFAPRYFFLSTQWRKNQLYEIVRPWLL